MKESLRLKKNLVCPISIFGPAAMFCLYNTHLPIIEKHENYQKRSMRNRTRILSANGPMNLSIPLRKGKTKTPITEVKISYAANWMKDYLQAIRSAYANAPYFDFYFSLVESAIRKEHVLLFDLAQESLFIILNELSLPLPEYTDRYIDNYPECIDLRQYDVTEYVKASTYVQVFSNRYAFVQNLSILDALFNIGPETAIYISQFELLNQRN